jgi:hypothetical protein
MYAWLVLLTCLSWLVFAEFQHRGGWPLKVFYALLLMGLVYSHPLGLFMVAAHGLAYLIVHRSLALGFRSWLAIQVAVLLAIAPWIPRYLDHGTDYPLPRYPLRFLLAVPIEYIGGNSMVLLACALIVAIGIFSVDGRRLRLTKPAEDLLLLVWTTVPPVLMYAYSEVARPIFGPPRYHLFIAPAYLILLAHGLCQNRLLRWTLATGTLYLSLTAIDANVYSQVVKADWRRLAHWLNREEAVDDAAVPKRPATLAIHPSDLRFPRDQIEAARYYLSPPHRVLLAGTGNDRDSSESGSAAERVVLHVYCLSAQQVREGSAPSSYAGFPGLAGHRAVPEFYGLVIRRR